MSAALVVLAHPRGDSLTAQLARRAVARLEADGHTVDVLDLHAEGFDPRMGTEDEPDWSDPDKEYSAETRAHMDRIAAAEILVVVFPLWWFGLPAILKGWIDRVWNNGFAYGLRTPLLKGKRMVWIPLVSYPEAKFKELGWDGPVDEPSAAGWKGRPASLGTTTDAAGIGVRGHPGCSMVRQANSRLPASSATGSVPASSTRPW
ncbi:NAD(P)H oxidoreductase [Streptomyces sp. G1]|uniref:NAD(P)H oxidoreductase n=1 Tax=Streptomyces sp. G1 TaxID=361572 RepID=UPI002030A3F3|nr:NAD(P)H oxidoreductase [Streptomyces sp. G1]MCM1969150.1 NAD(P)H oxidoreductase [Streptomyces sp. G1]